MEPDVSTPDALPYGVAPPGFRLPAATHVGRVRLQVSNLERSIDFYQNVLGLRVYGSSASSAVLGVEGETSELVSLETTPGVTPARGGRFGLYHFAVLLPERAALGRFAAHLFALGARVGMADHLVSEALYLSDPDRLGIEVYADRPRAAWRQRNRELAMATDPLDVSDLIAAGGANRWEAAPRGTSIGHVHLHVGDLEQAEAFYHRALGLDKMVWSYPGALFLAAGGYHHHLGTNVWSPGPAPAPNEAQLLDWELRVPRRQDVADAARSLRAAGGVPEEGPDGVLAAVDPWGTRLQLRAASHGGAS